jgi:hypothetical protein
MLSLFFLQALSYITSRRAPTTNYDRLCVEWLLHFSQGLDPTIFSQLFTLCKRCKLVVLDDISAEQEHRCLVRTRSEPPTPYLFKLTDHPGATLEEFERLFVICSKCGWVITPFASRFHVCYNAQLPLDDLGIVPCDH